MGIFKKEKKEKVEIDKVRLLNKLSLDEIVRELTEFAENPAEKSTEYTARARLRMRNSKFNQAMSQILDFQIGEKGIYKVFYVSHDRGGICDAIALPWTNERQESLLANLVVDGLNNSYSYGSLSMDTIISTPEDLNDKVLALSNGKREVKVANSLQELFEKTDEEYLKYIAKGGFIDHENYDLPSAKALRVFRDGLQRHQEKLEEHLLKVERFKENNDSLELLKSISNCPKLIKAINPKIKGNDSEIEYYEDYAKGEIAIIMNYLQNTEYMANRNAKQVYKPVMERMHKRSAKANADMQEYAKARDLQKREERQEIYDLQNQIRDKNREITKSQREIRKLKAEKKDIKTDKKAKEKALEEEFSVR